jgi:hypothetical protein
MTKRNDGLSIPTIPFVWYIVNTGTIDSLQIPYYHRSFFEGMAKERK